MKEYSAFTAQEFAQDEIFLKWVKYPDRYPELDHFWQNWLRHHTHKTEELEEARQLIMAIVEEEYKATDEQQQEIWNRINVSVAQNKGRQVSLWSSVLSKAAVVIMMLGAGFAIWKFNQSSDSQDNITIAKTEGFQIQANNGSSPKTVTLSDGSLVVLEPHSKIEFPLDFTADQREVHLTGEAFFEVKKDPTRPFLVYTNEIVTRVLGTSFTIRNYKNENIRVQVKTGKVSVFKEPGKRAVKDEDMLKDAVVLTPNQQVEYERDKMKLTKSLVENPGLLRPVAKVDFEFTDKPVSDVFALIEEAYGVKIVYDKDVMANCFLNASLSDVSLNEKLKLICKGINAQYEIIDSQIVVYSHGCDQ